MNRTDEPNEPSQYLTFVVDEEEYAIEILRVREVVENLPITQVPATPRTIRGVINLRGSVVPVIDPGVRFGFSPRPVTKWTCIVLVDVDVDGSPLRMGLLVDAVRNVVEIALSAVEPVPPFGSNIPLEFLSGMSAVGAKFVHLLDVDRVLSTSDLKVAASLPATPLGASEAAEGQDQGSAP